MIWVTSATRRAANEAGRPEGATTPFQFVML